MQQPNTPPSHSGSASPAFAERAVAELASGAQFLLWCLRARVECRRTGQAPEPRLARAFGIAGLAGSELAFERLFRWVDGTAVCTVRIGCLRCSRVTREEGLILAALAAFQAEEPYRGQAWLAELLPAAAALSCGADARTLARALRGGELPVALADRTGSRHARTNSVAAANANADAWTPGLLAPGSRLIH